MKRRARRISAGSTIEPQTKIAMLAPVSSRASRRATAARFGAWRSYSTPESWSSRWRGVPLRNWRVDVTAVNVWSSRSACTPSEPATEIASSNSSSVA